MDDSQYVPLKERYSIETKERVAELNLVTRLVAIIENQQEEIRGLRKPKWVDTGGVDR